MVASRSLHATAPRRRHYLRYTARWLIGAAVAAVVIVPLLYGALNGFKPRGEVLGSAALLPSEWIFTNYGDILVSPDFWREVGNSVLVATITAVVAVIPGAMAAFVLARMSFRGRESMYLIFTLGLLFPVAVAVLPLFVLLRGLGLLGNPLGVALPQAAFALPLTIVILRPFFRSIPSELEDAARVDGCSAFGFFMRIVVPLSRPALAAVTVLAVVTSWNAFLLPLLVFGGPEQWTLPLGVMNFSGQYVADWSRIFAFTTLAMVPAILFYVIAERQIVAGLTAGSVKE